MSWDTVGPGTWPVLRDIWLSWNIWECPGILWDQGHGIFGCPGTSGNILGYCGTRDMDSVTAYRLSWNIWEYPGILWDQGHGQCYSI